MKITYSPERLNHGKIKCEVTRRSITLIMESADVDGAGHHGDVISNVEISLSGESVSEIIKKIQNENLG